jgi:hypothetical protein
MSGDRPTGHPPSVVTPFGFGSGPGSRFRPPPPQQTVEEPLEFMLRMMRDPTQPLAVRIDLAKAAAPYRHVRLAPAAQMSEEGLKIEIIGGLPQDEEKAKSA